MQTADELTGLFRTQGLRVTPQRQAIFRLLHGNDRHPTVDALYDAARVEMPTISLKTVYQTVHDLEALGQVSLLDLGTGSVRVDPNVEADSSASRVQQLRTRARRSPHRRTEPAGPVPARLPRRRRRSHLPRGLRPVRPAADPEVTRPRPEPTHTRSTMPDLKGSQTENNLKEAFAGESQANRRYLYFAQKADIEGYPDVAALFRSVAEGETGHAFGHFDFLAEVGDPVTGVPVGPTDRQPQVRDRGRDLRVHRDVPGLRQDRARRGLRRDLGVARDARPGREEPRRPLHRRVSRRSASPTHSLEGRGPGELSRGRLLERISVSATHLYDPLDPVYFDAAHARAERDRTFQICSDCRICVRFCPSFKDLFKMIDEREDASDVSVLTDDQHEVVVDECYQCKLCYVVCPYTPGNEQDWVVDFPRLMLRSLAIEEREGKVSHSARAPRPDRPAGQGRDRARAAREPLEQRRLRARAHGENHRDRQGPAAPDVRQGSVLEVVSQPHERTVRRIGNHSGRGHAVPDLPRRVPGSGDRPGHGRGVRAQRDQLPAPRRRGVLRDALARRGRRRRSSRSTPGGTWRCSHKACGSTATSSFLSPRARTC